MHKIFIDQPITPFIVRWFMIRYVSKTQHFHWLINFKIHLLIIAISKTTTTTKTNITLTLYGTIAVTSIGVGFIRKARDFILFTSPDFCQGYRNSV